MPVIGFEGQQHEFPDDFTDEDISLALSSLGDNKPQGVVDTPELLDKEADNLGTVAGAKAHTVGFNEAVTYALDNEGGDTFTSDPDDAGGDTRFGISKRSYPDEDIQNMTKERAESIYRRDFWDKPKLGKLPERLATKVFDAGVNVGSERGVKLLQKQLDVTITGKVNDATVKAVEAQDEDALLKGYVSVLSDYYREVSKKGNNKKFLNGWLERAKRLPEAAEVEETPDTTSPDKLIPSKGGLFEDEEGNLFLVDEEGNKTEI